uniref:F-box/LRR-repeat protein 15/At3g58940/PEG3-like LRR domain-containing protein n=1 Tax=Oryza barthii TaxID=65489 RepID=A0A0D3F1H9_9ORYZ
MSLPRHAAFYWPRLRAADRDDAHPGPFPFVSLSCSFIGDDAQSGVAARWLDLLAAKGVEHLTLAVFGILNTLRARLSSGSLRCAQFCLSFMEEVAVLDAPRLERLFLWRNIKNTRVKIGHAPQLRMLGYLQPGVHQLEIGNTIIKARTIVRPGTTVPSVNMLALHLHFGVRNEVKMLPSFLRCFPNVETLCVEGVALGASEMELICHVMILLCASEFRAQMRLATLSS